MWLVELMSWVVAGLVSGAVFTGLTRERHTRREMRISVAAAVVGGLLARLVDSPRPLAFSVLSVFAALGGAGCALLLDWLNVGDYPSLDVQPQRAAVAQLREVPPRSAQHLRS
jgi:hypothetical protein